MSEHRQRGFSVVEVVIALLVVAAIGATGYLAYNRMKGTAKAPIASDQVEKATTPAAPAVNNKKDLDGAAQALDNTNVDAATNDQSDLDAELSNF